MTERLYYADPFLTEFDAQVTELVSGNRTAIVLDRTAFYPTSGGQLFDTGRIEISAGKLRVTEVLDDEQDRILHYLELDALPPQPGTRVHGVIDAARRREHMQQHSGQHVLSAAFVRLFDLPTVSFHMGADSCTIDLDAKALSDDQIRHAEDLANSVVMEDRPVEIRFATRDEASQLGVRKLPPNAKPQLRLIDIHDFDLTACGGTHVRSTGQIGSILLRSTEKVRQGIRVEFVCGQRAIEAARRDHAALADAAAVLSAHLWDVPQQVRKSLDEAKNARKLRRDVENEIAALHARELIASTPVQNGFRLVSRVVPDRDAAYIKLLAQKLTADPSQAVIALLAAPAPAPTLIFAQSAGLASDMGRLLKDVTSALGGRGGGARELAQGGLPTAELLPAALEQAAAQLAR